jgi:leucyl aminopeptidase
VSAGGASTNAFEEIFMQVTVESGDLARVRADLLALPLLQLEPRRGKLPSRASRLDRALGGRLAAALESGDFSGKRGETLLLHPGRGVGAKRILLIGLGEEAKLDAEALRRAGGQAAGALVAKRGGQLALAAPATTRLDAAAVARSLTEGVRLGTYRFDRYKAARDKSQGELRGTALVFEAGADLRGARSGVQLGSILADSQNVARDLSNEPANALPPAALAAAAQRVAREVGLRCKVLEVPELRRRKLGAILAVGQGSASPPCLVVLEHDPRRAGAARKKGARLPTICLVGKAITFDSGGISIKPGAGMHEMKHDMSGAAAVVGALRAAALLDLPLRVVGILAAAENMPSGTAYRPGDVVKAGSGTTVEVLNTDAEGRLVLADGLHLALTDYEPDAMVDLATLTGACVVALGKWCSGLFSNDEALGERLRRAGEASGERAWPMPLWDEHREHIRGDVGDLKNTGGRDGGAITAAAFLSCFVGKTPWAHLDIAGTAYTEKTSPYQPKGATGVGVRLLVEALRDWRAGASA